MPRLLFIVLFIGQFAACIGCKDNTNGTVPVSVTITQKGTAVSNAAVTVISSDGKGQSGSGLTNESGVAVLQTPQKWKGLLPGEYKVAVKKWENVSVPSPSTDDPNGMATTQKNILPAKYADHATSGFILSVDGKSKSADFDIAE